MSDGTPPTPEAASRGVSGKRFVPGCALALLAVVGLTFFQWFRGREPHGPIYAAVPAPDGGVVLLRQGYEERGYAHLVVRGPEGLRWSEPLFGLQDEERREDGVLVRDGVVFLRAREARGHAQLHAFDLEQGSLLWRADPPTREGADAPPPFRGPPLHAAADVVFDLHGADPVEVMLVDAGTGAVRSRVEVPGGEGLHRAWVEGERLFVDGGTGYFNSIGVAGDVRRQPLVPVHRLQDGGPQLTGPFGPRVLPEGERDLLRLGRVDRGLLRAGELVAYIDGAEVRALRAPGLRGAGLGTIRGAPALGLFSTERWVLVRLSDFEVLGGPEGEDRLDFDVVDADEALPRVTPGE